MRNMPFLFFTILFIVSLSACGGEADEQPKVENTVTPVETAEIITGDFMITHSVYGTITPSKQAPVIFQQPGEITEIKVENGTKVKKDERLGTVKTQMGSLAVTAPTDGEVAHLQLKKSDFFTGEEPFALIIDNNSVNINFFVTPQMREFFKQRKQTKVLIDDKEYKAEITMVDSLPNEAGQYQIEADLNNEEAHILPGMTAEILVEDVREKNALLVPTEAIITESGETFLFIVQDDKAKRIDVTVLHTQSDQSAIEATDIKDNDQVVVTGQFLLTDGTQVEVVKEGK